MIHEAFSAKMCSLNSWIDGAPLIMSSILAAFGVRHEELRVMPGLILNKLEV